MGMERICFNCGCTNFYNKFINKKYYFRGQEIYVKVSAYCCKNCGDFEILDTEKQIIKKIYAQYIKENNLPAPKNITSYMHSHHATYKEIEQRFNLPRGSVKAAENGNYIIENKDFIKAINNCIDNP